MIEGTITEWATSSGKDYKTMKTAFNRIGVDPEHGEKIPLLKFMEACMGDEKLQKIRNLELDAKEKELRIAKEEGRLYEPELVQSIVDKCGGLVRQALLQARAELPPRCNPSEPRIALVAIDQWLDRFWPDMRREVGAQSSPEPSELHAAD